MNNQVIIPDRQPKSGYKTEIEFSGGVVSQANPLPVLASIDTTGLATAANQQTDALTDAELRASPVPVLASIDTTGLATEDKQDDIISGLSGLATSANQQTDALTDAELRASPIDVDTGLTQPTTPADTQPVSAASLPLPTGAATSAKQDTIIGHIDGIETDTAAIKTAVEIIDNAISGNEMQVDVVGALPAGTNAIGKLAANSGVDIGDVDVTSISAGTNLIGDVGIQPRTSNGLAIFRSIDLDESEEEVKATAGQVFGWYIQNKNAATLFVKFYNATAANVTVGTTTPVMTLPIPTGSAANVMSDIGIAFSTAITVAATTGVADADTGAPAANDCIVNIFYK
jgi:hypothetical protein